MTRRSVSGDPSDALLFPLVSTSGRAGRSPIDYLSFVVPGTDIKSVDRDELAQQFHRWGEPGYRLNQVLDWLYAHRVTRWDEMTNVPKRLRELLQNAYSLTALELVRKQGSLDTTQKFLWRLHDHSLIETVLIPANPALYGEPNDRHTLCVSTQVGCAYGCKFCASGLGGWKRNLGVEEIVDQVLAVERSYETQTSAPSAQAHERAGQGTLRRPEPPGERFVGNLVIMGMGEPLANYNNLLKALKLLNAPWGGRIGARKITVSTSGLAPQIRKLADEPMQLRLAISLHGATDEIRGKIMPVNRKYPLRELTAACEYYHKKKGRILTIEYILISGVNDSPDQAVPLARLARKLKAKINLIPYNRVEGLPWERPAEAAQNLFLRALQRQKVSVTLRHEKGHDIDAACGQLRLRTERELTVAR